MSKDFRIPCTGRGYVFSRDSFIDLAFKQFGLPITDYSTKSNIVSYENKEIIGIIGKRYVNNIDRYCIDLIDSAYESFIEDYYTTVDFISDTLKFAERFTYKNTKMTLSSRDDNNTNKKYYDLIDFIAPTPFSKRIIRKNNNVHDNRCSNLVFQVDGFPFTENTISYYFEKKIGKFVVYLYKDGWYCNGGYANNETDAKQWAEEISFEDFEGTSLWVEIASTDTIIATKNVEQVEVYKVKSAGISDNEPLDLQWFLDQDTDEQTEIAPAPDLLENNNNIEGDELEMETVILTNSYVNKEDDYAILVVPYDNGIEKEEFIIDLDNVEEAEKHNWFYDKKNNSCHYYEKGKVSTGLHRIIMGQPKGKLVIHKNLNKLDCRKENLIILTQVEHNAFLKDPEKFLAEREQQTKEKPYVSAPVIEVESQRDYKNIIETVNGYLVLFNGLEGKEFVGSYDTKEEAIKALQSKQKEAEKTIEEIIKTLQNKILSNLE